MLILYHHLFAYHQHNLKNLESPCIDVERSNRVAVIVQLLTYLSYLQLPTSTRATLLFVTVNIVSPEFVQHLFSTFSTLQIVHAYPSSLLLCNLQITPGRKYAIYQATSSSLQRSSSLLLVLSRDLLVYQCLERNLNQALAYQLVLNTTSNYLCSPLVIYFYSLDSATISVQNDLSIVQFRSLPSYLMSNTISECLLYSFVVYLSQTLILSDVYRMSPAVGSSDFLSMLGNL